MIIASDYPLSVFETFALRQASALVNANSVALTNVVNVSEIGILSQVTVVAGGGGTSTLEIQIDGQTTESIPLWTAGMKSPFLLTYQQSAPNDPAIIPIGLRYGISCRVGINVTVGTVANIYVVVVRGVKL